VYARTYPSRPYSSRVYYWGALAGKHHRLKFDRELLYAGAMFHDMGLNPAHSSAHERFEVDGANVARDFLRAHGIGLRLWGDLAATPLHAYREYILTLTVSSIGWGAKHTVKASVCGTPVLRRHQDPPPAMSAGSPMRLAA
jgi:hypothetical protein